MRRTALVVAGVLVVGAMTLIPTPPVHATGVCAGSGFLTTSAPMFDPVTPLNSPVVRPAVTTSFSFGLSPGSCANGLVPPTFDKQLSATGTLTGWCGLMSGTGTTGSGETFAFVNAGGIVVFTGGLVGAALLSDAFADGGCDGSLSFGSPGSRWFHIHGAGLKTHCSATQGLTPVPVPSPWHVWTMVCIPSPLLA